MFISHIAKKKIIHIQEQQQTYLRSVCERGVVNGVVSLEVRGHQVDSFRGRHPPEQDTEWQTALIRCLIYIDAVIIQCDWCVNDVARWLLLSLSGLSLAVDAGDTAGWSQFSARERFY